MDRLGCPPKTMSPLPRPTPTPNVNSIRWVVCTGTPASQTDGETDGRISDNIESRLVWVQNVITLAYCDYKVEKTRHFCRFQRMLESSKAFSFRGAKGASPPDPPTRGSAPGPPYSLPLAMTPAFRFLFLYDWSTEVRWSQWRWIHSVWWIKFFSVWC